MTAEKDALAFRNSIMENGGGTDRNRRSMGVRFEDHPFWDFSLSVYGSDGVPAACIALQERYALDVNILLLCVWAGRAGMPALGAPEWNYALATSQSWNREIVCAVRDAREKLSGDYPGIDPASRAALRADLLAFEIDCEHAEQLALGAGLDTGSAATGKGSDPARLRGVAIANLRAYFQKLDIAADEGDLDQLTVMVRAAFPECDAPPLSELWEDAG